MRRLLVRTDWSCPREVFAAVLVKLADAEEEVLVSTAVPDILNPTGLRIALYFDGLALLRTFAARGSCEHLNVVDRLRLVIV